MKSARDERRSESLAVLAFLAGTRSPRGQLKRVLRGEMLALVPALNDHDYQSPAHGTILSHLVHHLLACACYCKKNKR